MANRAGGVVWYRGMTRGAENDPALGDMGDSRLVALDANDSGGSSLSYSVTITMVSPMSSAYLTAAIESSGSTSLVQVENNYSLYPVGGSSGPQLRFSGVAVTMGQFGSWMPIAAEQVGSGYQIVWKATGADQYGVWNADGGGNYLSAPFSVMSGGNGALQSLETGVSQDLNGDGVTGVATTVIESSGATSLVRVADRYAIGGALGPQLTFSGVPVTAGQFGAWMPIAAEQTASGYQIVWSVTGADQYGVWNTDFSDTYLSAPFSMMSGGSLSLQSLETGVSQDLNGDGVTGVATTVIESSGATSLVRVADRYAIGGALGPQLTFSGVPVTAGQFGMWMPIAAEQVGGGFQIVWKNTSVDQYGVWNTDSGGNYLSAPLSVMSGSSWALESLETSFSQDLNGDGVTGVATTVIESFGATSLVRVADRYAIGGALGPQLTLSGVPVTAGPFGSWTAIGVEHTAGGGYEVAWKVSGADQYSVWNTDSNGNYLSNAIGVVPGSSAALESLETSFAQDLNGDGVTGLVIEASGATRLVLTGDNYFMHPVSGASGPVVKLNGLPVAASQTGSWTAIGAEQTAGGRLPGRSPAPINTRSGTPIAAISSRPRSTGCLDSARRSKRWKPVSTRISMATGRSASARR